MPRQFQTRPSIQKTEQKQKYTNFMIDWVEKKRK
jgi:hypothetical protein